LKLVAFDLYGTLLDMSGIADPALLVPWRKAQLELTWTLNQEGRFEPFDQVTRRALDQVAPGLSAAEAERLCAAWLTLPAFPEVAPTLQRLRAAGARTAILSNGTRAMIESAVGAAGLPIDDILSVEQVGVYKPDPRVYALLPREGTLFVSANPFDAEGARHAGLTVCAIDRAQGGTLDEVP